MNQLSLATWLEKYQVALYLLALVLAALCSWGLPESTWYAEVVITPSLALLLLATFLSIPLRLPRGKGVFPKGFLLRILGINFLLNPLIIGLLLFLVPLDEPLKFAAALVLLAPCIDYVVVFTGLAGGSKENLLKATPFLLIGQIIMVPTCLYAYKAIGLWEANFLNGQVLERSLPAVLSALATIALPLLTAWLIQRSPIIEKAQDLAENLMVPLMLLVLFSTVFTYFGQVSHHIETLLPLVLVYAGFALITATYTWLWNGQKKQTPPDFTATIFSAVTRNSLVVLPIALAISKLADQPQIPIGVVTQTLVELLIMVLMVRAAAGRTSA